MLGALLRPGEVDEVDVSIGPDRSGAPEHLWGTHLGPEPGRFVWLRVLCSGEAYDRRVCEVTDQPEDAFALSCDLYSDLKEFVAESRFGWGQLRDGDWTVPPP
ncbi:hypothetical protein [Kineosporia sp. A_224]|uniref:hypothetical protein n=1 Tax=Kineosporia sp. A_224 TaxID=1962180 RepID=UPI000B4A6681|nr:hypothetical protein [Kineosporia sp. A_224]